MVSESRSMGKASEHAFVVHGQDYAVRFNVISMLRGHLECFLSRDGQPVSGTSARYRVSSPKLLKGALIMFVAGFVTATVQVVFALPWIMTYVILAPILLLVGRRYAGHFEFADGITSD